MAHMSRIEIKGPQTTGLLFPHFPYISSILCSSLPSLSLPFLSFSSLRLPLLLCSLSLFPFFFPLSCYPSPRGLSFIQLRDLGSAVNSSGRFGRNKQTVSGALWVVNHCPIPVLTLICTSLAAYAGFVPSTSTMAARSFLYPSIAVVQQEECVVQGRDSRP